MAELSKGGTEMPLSTGSASTRPSASAIPTGSADSGRTASSTRPRASAIAIRSAIRPHLASGRLQW